VSFSRACPPIVYEISEPAPAKKTPRRKTRKFPDASKTVGSVINPSGLRGLWRFASSKSNCTVQVVTVDTSSARAQQSAIMRVIRTSSLL